MSRPPNSRLATALTCIGIGVGFALFGLSIDLVDRTFPFQGRPAFDTAPLAAHFIVSLYRILAGAVIGWLWQLQQRKIAGLARRFLGFEIAFIAAALLRGSLAAWLNAPVEHIVLALPIGALAGAIAFAIAELGQMALDPPPPPRLP